MTLRITKKGGTEMPSFYARVFITCKPEVLDPQGQAVRQALQSHGYEDLQDVRIGKFVELWLQADGMEAARSQVEEMCRRLLANPVMENYRVDVSVAAAGSGAPPEALRQGTPGIHQHAARTALEGSV